MKELLIKLGASTVVAMPLTAVYTYCDPYVMFMIACLLAGFVGAMVVDRLRDRS